MREAEDINKPQLLKTPSTKSETEYHKTIAELEERLKLQGLISEITSMFINLPADQVDGIIEQGLKRIVEFLGLGRSTLAEFSNDLTELRTTHSYNLPNIEGTLNVFSTNTLPWYSGMLLRGEIVVLENTAAAPDEAVAEKAYTQSIGMKSHLGIPVAIGGSLLCAVGFSDFRNYRSWPEEVIEQLKRVAEVLAYAVYRKRTDQVIRNHVENLEKQLQFETLLAYISARFVSLRADQIDSEIEDAQRRVCECLNLDLCAVWQQATHDQEKIIMTHIYPRLPGSPQLETMEASIHYPWVWGQIRSGSIVKVSSLAELPLEAARERENAESSGIKSNLTLPLSAGGEPPFGAVAFNTTQEERTWPEEIIMRLKLVAEVFAQAVYRKRAEEKLENQFEFEKLISDLSARFVILPPGEVDRQIEEGLKMVVEFLEVDRSALLKFSEDKRELVTSHIYAVEGVERVKRVFFKEWLPWVAAKVIQGEMVHFSSASELPDEAALDRENLKRLNLKSTVIIPVSVGGAVEYALTVGAAKQERSWPEEIIPRLRLIGELFVNALVRKANAEELRTAYNEIARLSEQLKRENIYLQEEIKAGYDFEEMIGHSGGLKYLFYKIKQVAPTDATVLIEGETGTGKELVARALHEFSSRKDRPLVKVDCSSLPASMIENELFGHEKGAFTGAHDRRIGRFELADGATVFLDEIGEIPPELQTKLLRVLQDGEFERLGSSHTLKVDVRIIAATNRNLKEEIKNGNFREDLYYRLNVFPLSLPPLRERKEDIAELAESFVQRFSKKLGKTITTIPRKVKNALQNYSWPGNVRELENVIERAVITTEGSALQLMDILEDAQAVKAASAPKESLEERERDYIIEVLEETYWRIEGKKGAAMILGLHPDTLRSRMKKLGIRRPTPKN